MTETQSRELPTIEFDFPPEALASTNLTEILSIKNQAPRMSATAAWNLAELAHAVPCATTPRRAKRIGPGDPAPEFSLESTDGGTLSLDDLRGRATVLVLARAMRTGGFCPISTGTMDDLRTTHDAYREADVRLVVVAATNVDEARGMVEGWSLPYPLYANPDFSLFEAYDVGYLGPPLHGWIVIDADGIVQYVYRTIDHADQLAVPTPLELLERAKSAAG
jgi:peroxiredoxin